MLEVNIIDERWFDIIENPENFVSNVIYTSLRQLKIADYNPNISVALANDSVLHQLNLKFRKIDKSTNVLSFPYEQLSHKCDLGDIAISLEVIKRESQQYCIPILHHVSHMLIHGLLHLLEYDHKTKDEETIMQSLEREILISLDFNLYEVNK